MFPTVAVSLG